VLTLLGCIPWVLMLTLVGKSVGDNWEEWRDHLHYIDYVVLLAIVVGVAYLIVRRRRGGGPGEGEVGAADERGGAARATDPSGA
jgi:hypothetical protein